MGITMSKSPRMKKGPRKAFSEMNLARIGFVGLASSILLLAVALNIGKVMELVGNARYSAEFSEAGGLRGGDDVRIDGLKVGKVDGVELEGDQVKVSFSVPGVRVGNRSTAAVKSNNALGSKFLSLSPTGNGDVHDIPVTRTDAGISINAELGQLTADTAKIDANQLAASFESISKVLAATPDQFRSALTGVGALSQTISSRNSDLQVLLQKASDVSSVLASRNQQITGIVSDGGALFQELQQRRVAISQLLTNVKAATDQMTALAQENQASFGPALQQLQNAAALLTQYRSTLDYGLKTFGVYARALGESVGSGPFFQAYVANLASPEDLVTGGIAGLVTSSLGSSK